MKAHSPGRRGIAFRFFRFLWHSLKAFNTIVFSLFLFLLVALVIYAVVGQRQPSIPSSGALVLNLSGILVEQRTTVDIASVLQRNDQPEQTLVKDIIDALAMAKEDDRIRLVVLELDHLEHGLMPKLERIADAIVDFKSGGKKVIAVGDNYGQSALFLAAHANEILLNPEGIAAPEGFALYSPYFKSFLDNNNVAVNIFKVGKYKSAAESFVRDDMSFEAREALLAIINTWWNSYTEGVENARGLSPGSIDSLLQNLTEELRSVQGNLARLALEKGLVDRLATDAEQRNYLIELVGEDKQTKDYRGVSYNRYLSATNDFVDHEADKIAVITAVGDIVDGEAPAGTIGSRTLTALIRKARMDGNVKAIVLRVDSGGGSKTASEIIRSELQVAQAAGIPLVASMGSVAGSGGYWISASADEIWATPTTVTGSIGVIGIMPSLEKTLERYGIYIDGIATTPIAGASVLRDVSPELNEVIQLTIDAAYQQFLNTVAQGRDMDVDAVHEIAQGRVWSGDAAQQLGLVDQLGDLEQAIVSAANLASVNEYSVWHVEPDLPLDEVLLQKLTAIATDALPQTSDKLLTQIASKIRQEIGFIGRLNDPHHAYVICTDCPLVP